MLEKPFGSQVRAIDAATGETRWTGDYEGWKDRSGMLATQSGLVVHGDLGGGLIVRDAGTGSVLKVIETGTSIMAAPMTYTVEGVQYIAVQAGWDGGGVSLVPQYSAAYSKPNTNRVLVFKRDGGKVPIPDDLPPIGLTPEPPAQLEDLTPRTVAQRAVPFSDNCSICHSNQPRAPVPNLLRMNEGTHAAFDRIVLEGLLLSNGMPRWDDLLNAADTRAIHVYLIDEQRKAYERDRRDGPQEGIIYSRGTTSRSVH